MQQSVKLLTDLEKVLTTRVYPSFFHDSSSAHSSHSSSASASHPHYWSKGVGYGSGGDAGSWAEIDKAAADNKKLMDAQFAALNELIDFIQTVPPSKRKTLADGISASRIPAIICSLLVDDSFTSMASRAHVYFSCFQIMAMLSIDENLAKILFQPTKNCERVIFQTFKQTKEEKVKA